MNKNNSVMQILKRLYWDLCDFNERKYYFYWLIWQIPGLAGDRIRAKYLNKKIKKAGKNFVVQCGTRFRSMENLIVGDNVTIGYDNFIQALGGVTLGNNVMTGPSIKIWSVNHNYQKGNVLVQDQGQTKDEVIIDDGVWIAANAFISPGVHLPEGVIVSGGSVVGKKAYKPYSIIAGNPARIIGFREGYAPIK